MNKKTQNIVRGRTLRTFVYTFSFFFKLIQSHDSKKRWNSSKLLVIKLKIIRFGELVAFGEEEHRISVDNLKVQFRAEM